MFTDIEIKFNILFMKCLQEILLNLKKFMGVFLESAIRLRFLIAMKVILFLRVLIIFLNVLIYQDTVLMLNHQI